MSDVYTLSPEHQQTLHQVARDAGALIMTYYKKDAGAQSKEDGSPTTLADLASETLITKVLNTMTPDIPVIAEEAEAGDGDDQTIPHGGLFWLVDPLDGTREFLKQNDEFAVNIALVQNYKPIYGLIYAPALKVLFYTQDGQAFKQADGQPAQRIHVAAPPPDGEGVRVVTSRSHKIPKEAESVLGDMEVAETITAGSALKFGLIAEGAAHVYPRAGNTMEWDTAAGQALVEAAGGSMQTLDGQPFRYQKLGYLNHGFVVHNGAFTRRQQLA